jgi:hypothetical protein
MLAMAAALKIVLMQQEGILVAGVALVLYCCYCDCVFTLAAVVIQIYMRDGILKVSEACSI